MASYLPVGTLRSWLLPLVSVALLAQVGCGSDSSSSFKGKAPGTEGGACDDGMCDDGLECLSNLCVDPDSGSSGTDDGSSSSSSTDSSGGTSSSSGSGGAGGGAGDSSTDSSGETSSTASGGSGGASSTDSSGGTDGGGTGGSGEVTCEGLHPIVNDQLRTCDEGSCYCAGEPVDTCFSAETIEACCEGEMRCGSDSEEPGVDCAGEHPVVTDEARTCEPGSCYCSDGDTLEKCLTEDIAQICCPSDIELVCVPAE